ncbi:hypothetical protein [Pseudobacteroides cellulosolvens]|uniref:Uncharacterized protein n=1 Tax=Pseudobacteroides cellulosolvens ATCC 35603 = DSM 2933 TaxID=398512 RepID=A0A0L6JWG8_9FIRM|nr:hypothetical protein [Pseudobacteroides cellulosolvens]KNY30089.1 hypothetical protein Bccel_5366 [Pseudobacteroides cellulosolvens ATCC 35603 = DSM 2933]
MGFSLMVKYDEIPDNIIDIWKNEFNRIGFIVEFDKDFSFDTWEGGLLPMVLIPISEEYVQRFGQDQVPGGFQMDIYEKEIWTNSPMMRSVFEFFCQCIGTATLANALDGLYCDGQNGIECKGKEAISSALNEIKKYELFHNELVKNDSENKVKNINDYNAEINMYVNNKLVSPYCNEKSNSIRFIDRSPHRKSGFICRSCGRSFGVDEIKMV